MNVIRNLQKPADKDAVSVSFNKDKESLSIKIRRIIAKAWKKVPKNETTHEREKGKNAQKDQNA